MAKVIVITGASGGIGAALAVQLGRQGHRLVLAARREKELSEVAARAAGSGNGSAIGDPRARGDAIVVACDVRRPADVERVRDRALDRAQQGKGLGKPGPFFCRTPREWPPRTKNSNGHIQSLTLRTRHLNRGQLWLNGTARS